MLVIKEIINVKQQIALEHWVLKHRLLLNVNFFYLKKWFNYFILASTELLLKRGLDDQTLPCGVKLQLLVEVEGKPKSVKWFCGNEELISSNQVYITQVTNEVYKLEIEKCELSDTGVYRVILSSDTDSIESSCKVTVYEEKLTFRKGLNDQTFPLVFYFYTFYFIFFYFLFKIILGF